MKEKVVVLLSGCIDSTTLAYKLSKEYKIHPLSILYGQKHAKEIESAKKIATSLKTKLQIADLWNCRFLFNGSALTSNIEVPEGHYEDKSMKITVVPNRNMVFLSLAAAYAVSINARYVAYAAHAGDHAIYPDCRPEFAESMKQSIFLATGIALLPEFINITKAGIVKLGLELKVPFELTWSCYQGKERPCFKCGTDIERTEAFLINNTKDPLLTNEEWETAVTILRK